MTSYDQDSRDRCSQIYGMAVNVRIHASVRQLINILYFTGSKQQLQMSSGGLQCIMSCSFSASAEISHRLRDIFYLNDKTQFTGQVTV